MIDIELFRFSIVVISGPGLEPGVKTGLPADIDIDATKAGDAPLEVEVLNPQNRKVKVDVDEEEPGIFAATYFPDKPGKNSDWTDGLTSVLPDVISQNTQKGRNHIFSIHKFTVMPIRYTNV